MSRRALALLLVLAAACGPASPPPPVTPAAPVVVPPPVASVAPAPPPPAVVDESFREHPPAAEAAKPFVPPSGVHGKLRNGIPVVVVHQASPFVALRVVASGGVPDVGADHAETVATMMLAFHAGTTTRNIYDIRETYVTLGMQEPETTWYADGVTISFVAPVSRMRTLVEIAADMTLHPSLDKMNFERWREQEANRDDDQATDASLTAERMLRRALYGSHGYSAGILKAAATRAVKRPDIVALQAKAFDPSRLCIVVAGGVDESDVMTALDDAFGTAPASGAAGGGVLRAPKPPSGARIVVVDKPGTAIAAIDQGFVGPAYGTPDVEPAVAAVSVLADSSFGRLTLRLRQERGDVPWVTPSTSEQRTSGALGWRTRAANDRVGSALAETDRIVRAFAAQGPTEEELVSVREREVFASTAWFQTAADTARAWSWVLFYGQPDDVLMKTPQRYGALTVDAVKAAAGRYLDADHMRTVIVGDWAKLREPLTALGWGPIEIRNAAGTLLRTETAPRIKH
ncbi:MAG: insulinase family protein [Polyangiaceae bacterium]|jgi:predicted Zn-dependent peptidase